VPAFSHWREFGPVGISTEPDPFRLWSYGGCYGAGLKLGPLTRPQKPAGGPGHISDVPRVWPRVPEDVSDRGGESPLVLAPEWGAREASPAGRGGSWGP
jgi:hypothetical protein